MNVPRAFIDEKGARLVYVEGGIFVSARGAVVEAGEQMQRVLRAFGSIDLGECEKGDPEDRVLIVSDAKHLYGHPPGSIIAEPRWTAMPLIRAGLARACTKEEVDEYVRTHEKTVRSERARSWARHRARLGAALSCAGIRAELAP